MSNRALKRIQQKADPTAGSVLDGSSADEDEETVPLPVKKNAKGKKKHVNPFELLMLESADGEGQEDGLVEEDVEEETIGEERSAAENCSTGDAASSQPTGAISKKKKKNKKKKKKSCEGAEAASSAKEVEDEIEASIQEVNRILGTAASEPAIAGSNEVEAPDFTVNMKALLSIDYRFLNPDTELRQRFGSRVTQAEQGRSRHHRNRVHHRQGRLVKPKDNWPKLGPFGLSMSVVEGAETSEGEQMFTFEHSPSYQQTQFLFLNAVESHNPEAVGVIGRDHPYHIDTILQLSEVFQMNEDPQTSAELLERALYIFEGAFHSRFNIATGNCRLDFRRQESRPFYLALFKHLTALGHKGCSRTALELCKLLISLDPDRDPLCALLMIDFYALRSEQYAFLIRMFEEWESYKNLSQLPNFAFSVPLAMFHLSEAEGKPDARSKADALLEDSLLMFPGLLMALLDKCAVKPDPRVANHPFFSLSAQASQPPGLQQLVALYVGRCHGLWKPPEVLLWLETVVKATLDLVDAKDPRVQSYAEKRKVRYQGSPRNIYRHCILSNIKEALGAIPPGEMNVAAILSYDPLPPTDAIVSYTRPSRTMSAARQSPLYLFFRSLLPDFGDREAEEMLGAEGGVDEDEGAQAAGRPDLRQGVRGVMDAMRNLLNNIQMAPPDNSDSEGEDYQEEWD